MADINRGNALVIAGDNNLQAKQIEINIMEAEMLIEAWEDNIDELIQDKTTQLELKISDFNRSIKELQRRKRNIITDVKKIEIRIDIKKKEIEKYKNELKQLR